jgi:predicted small secreted protein
VRLIVIAPDRAFGCFARRLFWRKSDSGTARRNPGHAGSSHVASPESNFSRFKERTRNIIMRKNLSIALALLALVGIAPMLGACHTTAGAGEDLSAGGHAITNSAEKHTP